MSMAKTPFLAAEATVAAGCIARKGPARTSTAIPRGVPERKVPTIGRPASHGSKYRRGGGMGADADGDNRGEGEDEGRLDRPTGFLGALRPGPRERTGQEDEQARPQGDPDRDGLEIWGREEPLGGRRAITAWRAGWNAFESGRES